MPAHLESDAKLVARLSRSSGLRRALAWARHLAADRGGAIAVTAGLMSTALLGLTGLSIDAGNWYLTRRAMQSAADAAAVGGALELSDGSSNAAVIAAAKADAARNGFTDGRAGAAVTPTIAANQKSVTVSITQPGSLFLAGLFVKAPTISATATASLNPNGAPVCILATSNTAAAAVGFAGNNGTIQANGCALVANSTSTDAIDVGNGNIKTAETCGPGGYTAGPNATMSPLPTRCAPLTDPLANLTPPSNANDTCQFNNVSVNGTQTMTPGVYCGGITIKGGANVTFSPGIYILRNGGLSAGGGANVSGNGVGFYLTGTGTAIQLSKDDLSLSGNVNVNITAPTSGPLAGIAIYQDHSAPTGDITNTIVGDGSVNFTGTLYFGNQNVVFTGNGTADGNAPFTSVIANTLTYSGNGTLVFNSNYQNTNVPPPPGMQLPVAVLSR